VKVDQQEACSHQVQTASDQLKHEHVLDKRKAIEEAVQLAQRQQQLAQAALIAQWKRRKRSSQQYAAEQLQQRVQGGLQQQPDEQRQLEPVEQRPKLRPRQQMLEPRQQPEKETRLRQRQDAVPQRSAEPAQQQQMSGQKHADEEQPLKARLLRQVPVQRQSTGETGTAVRQDDGRELQQAVEKRPEQQRPLQLPQGTSAQAKHKTADDEIQGAGHQQESGLNKPQEQKPEQPSIFQVPPPGQVKDYKQNVDGWLARHDVLAPQPDLKQQHIDVNRQQQFEQLQQDKLHEQSQKGLSLFRNIHIKLTVLYFPFILYKYIC